MFTQFCLMMRGPIPKAIFTIIFLIATLIIFSDFFPNRKRFVIAYISSSQTRKWRNDMEAVFEQNSDILPSRLNFMTANELCNNTENCVIPNAKQEVRIRIAPDFKIMNCLAQKSMSTVMANIMCYLYNRTRYSDEVLNGNMSVWDKKKICENLNEYHDYQTILKEYKSTRDEWQISMITRDPVERFISGYVDRCWRLYKGENSCNGCHLNMTCFIISEYEKVLNESLEDTLGNKFEDRHFYPQNWKCHAPALRKKYRFLRYSSDPSKSLMRDLTSLLIQQNVSQNDIDYVKAELTTNRNTPHMTLDSPARLFYENRLRTSPFLMEYVVKMFYHDFIIFNYSFPKGF